MKKDGGDDDYYRVGDVDGVGDGDGDGGAESALLMWWIWWR